MKLTYYGHASFLVMVKGKKILFDPFITHNELAKHIDVSSIEADYIFLSHGHEDHVADAISIAKRTGAKIVAAPEVTGWFNKQGIENIHPMNIGGKWVFDFGTVKAVVAQHSSGLPDGSYGGNPMGFVFATGEGNFYYSGDTALTLDMQLVPHFAVPDFAVLPLGDNFTMGAEDAAQAAKMVQAKVVVGIHYDTFGFIKIDKNVVKAIFASQDIDIKLPAIGETIEL